LIFSPDLPLGSGLEKSGKRAKVPYKPTKEEMMQILEYLASPAGESVLREISDKHDEYRVKLKIPEAGGIFKVKLSAGSIRELIRNVLDQKKASTSNSGIDVPIDFPPSCQLTKRLIAEHPEFLTHASEFRVIDIQTSADEFHRLHPDDTLYNVVLAFPNLTPLSQSWVMEFRAPIELRPVGHDRIAVIFTALPTEPDFKLPANFHHVPAWAMSAVVVSELKGEIQWLPAHLVYYVGRSGELVVPPGGEFCTPMKMYPNTRDAEIQYWTSSRDWFLAPCLHSLSRMNSRPGK
jgi:hypothetical protein